MSRVDFIIDYYNSLPEVKRIHELESFIDNNKEIKANYKRLKFLQKQIVNSKEYHQVNQYNMLVEEYNNLKDVLLNYPFVSEYLEALDIIHNELELFTNGVEFNLNNLINGD